MKKNELVPVGNGESFTRCGWIRLALKTLFEDPHASFFVETIRFEKSNILDTEETRELLSPDATANIFTAFKDFFTMHTLPECQCSNRQWWGITLTTDIGDIYFYNSSDSEVFSSCGQNLIRLLQKNLTINHLFILEKPELNIEASDGTSEITHHEMVSDLLKSFEFDKTKYRNILF